MILHQKPECKCLQCFALEKSILLQEFSRVCWIKVFIIRKLKSTEVSFQLVFHYFSSISFRRLISNRTLMNEMLLFEILLPVDKANLKFYKSFSRHACEKFHVPSPLMLMKLRSILS